MVVQWLLSSLMQHRRSIMLFWLLVLLLLGFFSVRLPLVLQDHGLMPSGAYAIVQDRLASDFHMPDDPVMIVFENKSSVKQFRAYIDQTLQNVQQLKSVKTIQSPLLYAGMMNKNYAYALLSFHEKGSQIAPIIDQLNSLLPQSQYASAKLTGKPVVQADVNKASLRDLTHAERIGIPIAFIILWIAFGGLVSALIPIVIGVITVASTMGIMYFVGQKIELSNFVLNVIPMVGLALSIDFALLIVNRFREELQLKPVQQALHATIASAGRAVLYSALCFFLGLAGIMFIPLPLFHSVALGAIIVLTIAVMLVFTLMPIILLSLWRIIKSERPPVRARHSIWLALSRLAVKRPVVTAAIAILLLVLCFIPLFSMKLSVPDASSLPQSYPSRIAFESYEAHFTSVSTTDVAIIAEASANRFNKDDLYHAYKLVKKLQADPNVLVVKSIFTNTELYRYYQNGNRMLMLVTLQSEKSAEATRDWLRKWEIEGRASADLPFLIGGEAKYEQEVFDAIFTNLNKVFLFILTTTYVLLLVAFRSLLIPVKTILMNLMSLGAAFGILTWLFQKGIIGAEPENIAIMIPVFIFGLVFGISMDYGVFLLSRIFEEYKITSDNKHAVITGLASISRLISAAAGIMIAVTVPFAFGEVVGVKQLGIGIAVAILIDATIIRMVLVPVLMVLLGKWNWWLPGAK